MKLSAVKAQLSDLSAVNFQLPDGTFVPQHFHITEVGVITKDFIDCGGTVRHEKVANFQLWEAGDFDHRLAPQKLKNIIELSEKVLGIDDLEVEVEFQSDTIGKYDLAFNDGHFVLVAKQTACLAQDACGIPAGKQKVRLSALGQTNDACTPGGSCCSEPTIMFSPIHDHCTALAASFAVIPEERKAVLSKISAYIRAKTGEGAPVRLVYICTHNSRRSHFGQVWAAVAASYYGIRNVQTYSGGTETTAFHPNAIGALQATGFDVRGDGDPQNPVYAVHFGDNESVRCFSKVYNDAENPREHFAAIMTCSDAETNCPYIPGAELRVATAYDDPKAADGTPEAAAVYLERSDRIAREALYVFSLIH